MDPDRKSPPAPEDAARDAAARTAIDEALSNADPTRELSTRAIQRPGQAGDDDLVGTVLAGQFRVERPLGSGGMGLVYIARQIGTSRAVALKVLRPEVPDPGLQQRFLREAEILARLQHPNIVTIFAVGETPTGRCFIAMEYLEGKTLAEELTNGPLALDRLLRIGEQLARALVAAHHQGIVHRDLKPQNVMLVQSPGEEPDGVKVLDFGIARLEADEDASLTREGMVIGTPEYLSPEQARGFRVDTRSDLYNLGLILYRAATGLSPVEAKTPLDFLRAHAMDVPRPIQQTVDGKRLPAELARIVMRLLAKDPGQRPAAAEVLQVIKRLRTGESTGPLPAAKPGPKRTAWIAGAASLLVAGVAVAWMLGGRGGTDAAGSPEPASPASPAESVAPRPEPAAREPIAPHPAGTPAGEGSTTGPAVVPVAAVASPSPVAKPAPSTAQAALPPAPAARAATASRPAADAVPPRTARSSAGRADATRTAAGEAGTARTTAKQPGSSECDDVLSRLGGQLAALSKHPEEKDARCRQVKDSVGRAELRHCLVPADLGTRAMACF